MLVNGIVFPLPPLAHHTGATASGLWPTATADSASDRTVKYAQGGLPLTLAVQRWPTPNAVDHKGPNPLDRRPASDDDLPTAVLRSWPTPTAEDGESKDMSLARRASRLPDTLHGAAKQWPTPAARDYRAPNAVDGQSRLSRPPTSGPQLPNEAGGMLNPVWVELMLGYPPGWTECAFAPPRRGSKASPARSGAATPKGGAAS